MTNNPEKIQDLERLGVDVVERVALETTVYPDNAAYLLTKVQRMNHMLDASSLMSVLVANVNGHH